MTYSCFSGSPEWAARLMPAKGASSPNFPPDLLLMSAITLPERLKRRITTGVDQRFFTPQSYVRAFQSVGTLERPINCRQPLKG